METRYLNTLIAAVDAGTFSKAAETLHITQSAVSQRIKLLEEHFGQQLLDRSGQRLVLTLAGQVVFAKAKDILEKEKELLSCLQESAAHKRLALCCTPTFGMAFLPQVLSSFLRRNSDLSDFKFVFLQPAEALRGLRNEEFDLAVIEHGLDQDFTGFERYAMPDDEMLLVAAATMALPNVDGVIQLADLKECRLFARRDGCSSKELMRKNLLACGFEFADFDGMIVSDDLRFTIQSVMEGAGVAYVSQALVSSYLVSGEMVGFRVAGFEHRRGRSVVMQPQSGDDALVKELLESLFEVVTPLWRPELVKGTGRSR
jgi:DNA-binding transcriptional LysR family regulator